MDNLQKEVARLNILLNGQLKKIREQQRENIVLRRKLETSFNQCIILYEKIVEYYDHVRITNIIIFSLQTLIFIIFWLQIKDLEFHLINIGDRLYKREHFISTRERSPAQSTSELSEGNWITLKRKRN